MFLRRTQRKKDGKTHTYWDIVESKRPGDGRVLQRQVLYLGEINSSQAEAWRKAIEVFDEDAGRPRTLALFGAGPVGGGPPGGPVWGGPRAAPPPPMTEWCGFTCPSCASTGHGNGVPAGWPVTCGGSGNGIASGRSAGRRAGRARAGSRSFRSWCPTG